MYEGGNPDGPPLFFLHGNSLAADIFSQQLLDPAFQHFRLVALDLPGHGQSPAAPGHYSVPAMRAVVLAAVRALRLEQALVVAHSLSGLLLFGLLPDLPMLRGLMAVGAPPVTTGNDVQAAFQGNETVALYYTDSVTEAQAEAMARYALRPDETEDNVTLLAADILRADGSFRTELGASLGASELGDQVGSVARTAVPLALVAGALDHALHLGYYDMLTVPSRWGLPVHLVPGVRHTPFLESPTVFNRLLLEFEAATR